MKKLLFAVMAAAMASVASAATLNEMTIGLGSGYTLKAGYKADSVGGSVSELLGAGYSVYYFQVDRSKEPAATQKELIANAYLSALRSGQAADVAATTLGSIAQTTTLENGLLTPTTGWVDSGLDTVGSAGLYAHVLMAIVAEGSVYLGSTLSEAYQAKEGTKGVVAFGEWDKSNYLRDNSGSTAFTGSAEGWYAIPEPTSGLLLLIGMAGLALRRRRA